MNSGSPMISWAGCAFPVEGLGPGRRVAMWVRGCTIGCTGCVAPELHDRGSLTPVEEVAAALLDELPRSDGLTISGGEPFEQPEALAALIRILKEESDPELLVYTGYTLSGLRQRDSLAINELLGQIDILIDGPYAEAQPDSLIWRGSDNQQLHLLSKRAEKYVSYSDMKWPEQRPLSLQNIGNRGLRIIGIPRRGDSERLQRQLKLAGFILSADEDQGAAND